MNSETLGSVRHTMIHTTLVCLYYYIYYAADDVYVSYVIHIE